jgi:hypothetical protein
MTCFAAASAVIELGVVATAGVLHSPSILRGAIGAPHAVVVAILALGSASSEVLMALQEEAGSSSSKEAAGLKCRRSSTKQNKQHIMQASSRQ